MRPDDHDTHDDMRPHTPRRFALFFFESGGGGRTYLRFTRLGVIVILLLTIIPLIALLVLFMMNSSRPMPDVNTNISILPASPSPATSPVIRPAPPVSPPRSSKRPGVVTPASPTPQVKGNNLNGQVVTKPTPPPLPSESPP